tara:strand:+ start:18094 stop:18654 length:561 start_codon:yes stop_codon:yes gene_type:complete
MKSGKSALASQLSQAFDLPILSFAESLRVEVSQAFFHKQQKNEARFLWDMLEEQDKTLTRPILQAWGQGRRDLRNEDYWVNRLQEYADKKGIEYAIIDDVRHENEARHILDKGGLIIRLHANENVLISRGAKHLEHNSESLKGVDDLLGKYASQTVSFDTSGMTPYGMLKRLAPIVEDYIDTWGHN